MFKQTVGAMGIAALVLAAPVQAGPLDGVSVEPVPTGTVAPGGVLGVGLPVVNGLLVVAEPVLGNSLVDTLTSDLIIRGLSLVAVTTGPEPSLSNIVDTATADLPLLGNTVNDLATLALGLPGIEVVDELTATLIGTAGSLLFGAVLPQVGATVVSPLLGVLTTPVGLLVDLASPILRGTPGGLGAVGSGDLITTLLGGLGDGQIGNGLLLGGIGDGELGTGLLIGSSGLLIGEAGLLSGLLGGLSGGQLGGGLLTGDAGLLSGLLGGLGDGQLLGGVLQ